MNKENYNYLERQMDYIGFRYMGDRLADGIENALQKGDETFVLHTGREILGDRMHYELKFQKSQDPGSEYFFFNSYKATRQKEVVIEHRLANGEERYPALNSEALENRMSKIKWSVVGSKLADDEALHTEVAGVLSDLLNLTNIGGRKGESLRDLLEAKYLLHTPFQVNMLHPGRAMDRYVREYVFPVHSRDTDHLETSHTVKALEAYHMLCGRPVKKFMVTKNKESDTPWLQFDFTQKDINGQYKRNWYGSNFPFDLNEIFDKENKLGAKRYPFFELETSEGRDSAMGKMETGQLAAVTGVIDGVKTQLYITPVIWYKSLNVYSDPAGKVPVKINQLQQLDQVQSKSINLEPAGQSDPTFSQTTATDKPTAENNAPLSENSPTVSPEILQSDNSTSKKPENKLPSIGRRPPQKVSAPKRSRGR